MKYILNKNIQKIMKNISVGGSQSGLDSLSYTISCDRFPVFLAYICFDAPVWYGIFTFVFVFVFIKASTGLTLVTLRRG